ncbi:alpha/beta hydrolase [Leptolyngbya sp. FACHB-8]|uniref:alpha/beta hydrolase n=1 Tax=Leptolyngbya sp. FACHB-8 TaxID=2692814 RepID=UPI001689DFAC|nr:alpha/beta hydrolase [Leptolyngbya sp. FACHB-8]MBD1910203.1 alpha/beta hydrolase [Leptolyngbya sp. FACHB-8]
MAGRRPRQTPWRWERWLGWIVPLAMALTPAHAAERITLSYGLLERSISIETLEQFSASEDIPQELKSYTRAFTPEQVEQFRQLLRTRFDLSPVGISQFLYTDQGEALLEQLGAVVRTESGRSGSRALRAALVLAAFDPEGLTPLTVLQHFPLDGLQIDLTQTSQIVAQVQRQVTQTQRAIAAIEAEADESIDNTPSPNFSELPQLERRGSFRIDQYTFELVDTERDRTFAVDLYLPVLELNQPPPPIVVISHGLGSNRDTFAYLARHLTSHGFAVAVPEHPGSNTQQLEALIEGRAQQVTEPSEFINRPLDVTRLLDELERRAQQDPTLRGRYDVQHVGVMGQSLGAYTAFALAGVPLNRTQLAADCAATNTITFSLNLSLLLQCDVLNLPIPDQLNFRDERVKAIFAINTVGSSLLDRTALAQVDIPVMVVSGGADTVTPALPEQITPFSQLAIPDRYLLMMENATHFSAIDIPEGETATVTLPSELVGPSPAIAHQYLTAFSLAFFGHYLQNDGSLENYLTPAYARYLSQPDLPIDLVRNFSPGVLSLVEAIPLNR